MDRGHLNIRPGRRSYILPTLLIGFALGSGCNAFAEQAKLDAFDIPAGSLSSAINRLGSQSRLQILFDSSIMTGKTSPEIKGQMDVRHALEALLSGKGLAYRYISVDTIKIEPASEPVQPPPPDGATTLKTIVIRGREFNESAPGNAAFDSADIERSQASTLPQLLQRTPGVATAGGVRLQGQTTVIRGFARPSDTRVLLDGAPKNFELYDQGSIFIEPEILKSVELQKGATSVRYGNGGFGGTILMETKTAKDMLKPGQSLGGWTKGSYHTANNQRTGSVMVYGQSDFDTPVTYDGLMSGTWRKSGNMRVGGGEVYDASNDRLTTFTANGGAAYEGHEIRASLTYGRSDDWGPVAAVRGDLAVSQSSIDRYGRQQARLRALAARDLDDFSATLKYRYDGESDLVNFKAMASFSSTSLHRTRPIIPGFTPSASLGGQENDAQYSDIKFEAENTSRLEILNAPHVLNYGIQIGMHDRDAWMYDVANSSNPSYNYGYYASWIVPEGTQTSISAFIRDEVEVTDGLFITPGLRFDHVRMEGKPNAAPRYNNPLAGHDYSAVSYNGFTPALSGRWEATPSTTLFLDWAYAIRTPIIDELYSSQSIATKASATSRDLLPERNNSFNVGVSQEFYDVWSSGDTLTASVSGFYNHVTDPVTRRFGSANLANVTGPVPFYWNTPSYRIYGVEVKANYESDTVFGSLGLSIMNGSRKGAINDIYGGKTYPGDMAPLTVNASLGYRIPDSELSLRWTGQFVAEQKHTPYYQGTGYFYARPESGGYAVHGLLLEWTPKEGFMAGTEVRAGVENIFDKFYSPYLADGVSAMAGRNFTLSVSRKF
ncbi:TonB-dependent receptor domain-containing protein [Agrobacterium cavarae]|uniref:TonB-dependent receptor n=1 Tax=Agrobacterium cavarae TaxID=2528239 RepID=UPI003EE6F636